MKSSRDELMSEDTLYDEEYDEYYDEDYDEDCCYECKRCGDDYYTDEDGAFVCRCSECALYPFLEDD